MGRHDLAAAAALEANRSGPYASEAQALAHPACLEAKALHADMRIRSADLGSRVQAVLFRHIEAAAAELGVPLGAYDARALHWLAGMENADTAVVIGLMRRAYAAGAAAMSERIAERIETAGAEAKAYHYKAAMARAARIARGGK